MAAYARVAVARSSGGWTVSGNNANLAAIASFPAMASGAGGTVTYFGVGSGSSGATELDFFGTVTPNLAVVAGITPKLDTGTAVSNAVDGMSNAAATAFLTLFFNNTAWANIGNAGGLLPSSVAGSLYLSLHTSSPGEGGTQATNEISYS
jgi:nucleoside phosphorylase